MTAEPTSRRRLVRTLAEVGVVLAIYFGFRAYRLRDVVAGEVPSVVLADVGGRSIDVGAATGHARIVHVEATWCGVCQLMADNVARVADHRDGAVTIVVSRSPDEDARTVSVPGADVLLDGPGELARSAGIAAYPTTFFVDASGHIRATEVGYTSTVGLLARLAYASLF